MRSFGPIVALLVQLAASLLLLTKRNGARLVEVNVADTPLTPLADEVLRGPAGELLPRWWEENRPLPGS